VSNQDIREWAKAKGYGVGDKGRIAAWIKEEFEAEQGNGDGPDDGPDEPMLIVPDEPATPDAPVSLPEPPRTVEERKPTPPPRKRRRLLERPAKDAGKPVKRLPRVSVANLISSGWGLGAMALMRNGNAVPVGRVLQMQSPVAGVIVDDLVKGTAVDRLLQPLARAGERGEKAVALLGPPLITAAITARPELYPALRPMLKMSLMSWMTVSGPAMRKAQEQAARFTEDFGDVDLDGMIDALFSDVDVPAQPSEQEEANIRRARGE
jgi:hypothetical protein